MDNFILNKIFLKIPYNNLLFLCRFGSNLYGTNTDKSDHDYKGIYLPSIRDCLLNNVSKTMKFDEKKSDSIKNSKEDIDCELFSIQYYLELLRKGDTISLDILHAPSNEDSIIKNSSFFMKLYNNRKEFYTINLKAFIGYCRTQAAKYGIKGSRLNDAQRFVNWCLNKSNSKRLDDHWDDLPKGEHIHIIEANEEEKIPFDMIEICGKKIQRTATLQYAHDVINKFLTSYGERAKKAANNEGIDWKAVSHALRCAYEMKSIYENGDLIFPLKQSKEILLVKQGKLDYLTEVSPLIEKLMNEVEELSKKSNLPNKVNIIRWQDQLIKLYESKIKDSFL